jgi:hypothetical protein
VHLLGAFVALGAVTVSAQPAVSNLTGHVTDQTDAVIADAHVTTTNIATGAEWSSRTDADGRFTLQLLPPGTYDLKVAASGFAEWHARGLELNVGQTSSVDVQMTVTVVADVVVPATAREISSAIDGVLDSRQIEALRLATSSSWRSWFPATSRRRPSTRRKPTACWSRPQGNSGAAATSCSMARTTTTMSWAVRS